ncbi:MAG TPA: MASE1 domain-containing protein [Gemmatimonadales bacterium]|jgi:PAS domain S-box-containing protein|nr:MASE1 domain-containing protein [Gemmatimonadales bacterium]
MLTKAFLRIRAASLTWPVRAAALFAAYFIIAKLGLRFATIGESISPVWPPTGFAIASLVLFGWRYWPAILAGAFLANATTPIPLLAAAAIGCGNAGEALVGAYLMRGRVKLDEPGAVRNLVLMAAPGGALVSAATGVASLAATGALSSAGGFLPAFGLWWAGNFVGALTVVPLLLTWAAPSPEFTGRRTQLEVVALVVGCVLLSFLLLGRLFPNSFLPPASYPYLLFPLVIAAAVRGGPGGAALATLVVALIAVSLAAQGGGPFALRTLPATATVLLVYIAVLAMTGLVLGAESAHRRHAESALLDAHENLRAIIQSSPLAIYTLGHAGTVLTWNAAAERLYGWRADEVLGRPLPTSTEGEQLLLRDQVFGGQATTGMEVVRRRKDGSAITINLTLAPLHGPGGSIIGVLAIAADLTALRQLEVQYRQSQKVEAVGQLAGGIAHDFNNILTAILSTTQLLLKELPRDSTSARRDVEEIGSSARRAAGLTRQLLAFSRRQVLELKALDLNALIHNQERMLRRLIVAHIELRTELAPDIGTVRADAGQLEQVLMNLVVNARDALPLGGVITIATANVDVERPYVDNHVPVGAGHYVRLTLSDTGIGMDANTKSHLFEPFFTTKEPGKGTGLGLATVYGIVKQTGGYIWVESAPQQGTTFKILLPRTEVPGPDYEQQVVSPSLDGQETILLVEDQADVLRVMRRGLEGLGYTVLAAKGGPEALALAARHDGEIDLLVTDVVMPGMNGRDLALGLAATRPEMRVLYVSGYPDQSIVHQGLLAPGLAFLQKPFAPDALARKIREVLKAVTH